MVFLKILSVIVDNCLYLPSGLHSVNTSRSSAIFQLPIIQNPTVKQEELIRCSNNIFKCLSTINKTTGSSGYQWLNLPTTMQLIPQLDNHLSKHSTVEIPSLIQSTSPLQLLRQNISPTSSIFKSNFDSTSKQPVNATRLKPTNFNSNLQHTTSAIKSGSMLATFEPQDQLWNYQKRSLVNSNSNQLFWRPLIYLLFLWNGRQSTQFFIYPS